MGFDFRAPFGGDLALKPGQDVGVIGSTGDFDFLLDREELIQRIIRRLLTYRGEWIPFPNYGGSLRKYVNETLTQQIILQLQGDIVSQLLQEPDIARLPAPVVLFSLIPNGLVATIKVFTQALQPVSFSFNVAAPDVFTSVPVGVIS